MSCLALTVLALGCASQSSNTERQLREQEQRLKRLTATCDRLEERMLALEAVTKGASESARLEANTSPARPSLPTVKVAPEGIESGPPSLSAGASDAVAEDDQRVVIVGEGSRVEARTAGESSSSVVAKPAGKANSRASKSNQGSLPKASTSGAPQ